MFHASFWLISTSSSTNACQKISKKRVLLPPVNNLKIQNVSDSTCEHILKHQFLLGDLKNPPTYFNIFHEYELLVISMKLNPQLGWIFVILWESVPVQLQVGCNSSSPGLGEQKFRKLELGWWKKCCTSWGWQCIPSFTYFFGWEIENCLIYSTIQNKSMSKSRISYGFGNTQFHIQYFPSIISRLKTQISGARRMLLICSLKKHHLFWKSATESSVLQESQLRIKLWLERLRRTRWAESITLNTAGQFPSN